MKGINRILFGSALAMSGLLAVGAAADSDVEKHVEQTLAQMTTQEKLQRLGGVSTMFVRDIPRIGLGNIQMSDAGMGVRATGQTTAYPATIVAGASFDKQLVYEQGVAMGNDCRSRGVHILLAPSINIDRIPVCGRNFEYYGEDPVLTGALATQFVLGLQSRGVGATVKHFAVNNYEHNRSTGNSIIDERTLRELYLPAFKQVVQKGHVAAVMDAYNRINGDFATENHHLNLDILKGEWGFDGILMSDWGATHDTERAANAGLDLDMDVNDGKYFTEEKLQAALDKGSVSMDAINEKLRRQLRTVYRFGWDQRPQLDTSIPRDNPSSNEVALKLARGGFVMLKNTDNVLPIATSKKVVVLGPNANVIARGGGSSQTDPFNFTTPYDGLKKSMPNAQVKLIGQGDVALDVASDCYTERGGNEKGFKVEWFDGRECSGTPLAKGTTPTIDFDWGKGAPREGVPADNFSVRFTGVLRTTKANEEYRVSLTGDDGFRMWVDGKKVIDMWRNQPLTTSTADVVLEKAGDHDVVVEYFENGADASIKFTSGIVNYTSVQEGAAGADYAVVCVGYDIKTEVEGQDRTFTLPAGQDSLINLVASIVPNTIVVINAGGAVDVSRWINNVKGVIYAGYGGQSFGTALADIITGAVNPSGKLPFSWEKNLYDNPAMANPSPAEPNGSVTYKEGRLVGYRYYDAKNVDVKFPFGFGMSYTSFGYSNLKVKGKGHDFVVTVDVTNNGNRAGAESVQLYVEPVTKESGEPLRKLADFGKTAVLQPGETATVTMNLDEDAFSTWNTALNKFQVNKGKYALKVGASSRELRLNKTVSVK